MAYIAVYLYYYRTLVIVILYIYIANQTHLSLCGWLDVRVAGLTGDIIHLAQGTFGYPGEDRGTVVGKVAVHLPVTSKICRSLNHHGCWAKRLCDRRGMRCV